MISEAQGNSPRTRVPRYASPAQAVSSLRVLREPAGIERTITEILMDVQASRRPARMDHSAPRSTRLHGRAQHRS